MKKGLQVFLLSAIVFFHHVPGGAKEAQKEGPVIVYEHTIQQRPPFYKGPMPLHFKAGKRPFAMNEMITLYHAFDGWKNIFDYTNPSLAFSGIADHAKTVDDYGRVIAEARLVRILKGQGVEIEETHYTSNGKIQFKCRSQFDFGIGFKRSEYDAKGTKERDYYFIWPVSGF